MKRLILVISLTLLSAFISAPARAENLVVLDCVELPAPTSVLVTASTDPLYKAAVPRNYASLATVKAHPKKQTVIYKVRCQVGDTSGVLIQGSETWRQACQIVSMSYGRWIANTTGRSDRALIWQPLRCIDVLR